MKQKKVFSLIICIFAVCGILLLCLPALMHMHLSVYKYFIFSGILALSMAVIIPEFIKGCMEIRNHFHKNFV